MKKYIGAKLADHLFSNNLISKGLLGLLENRTWDTRMTNDLNPASNATNDGVAVTAIFSNTTAAFNPVSYKFCRQK